MLLPNHNFISSVIDKAAHEVLQESKSNCFNAVRNTFSENIDLKIDGPVEMMNWLNDSCEQIHDNGFTAEIFVIWSSDDPSKSPEKVDVHFLATRPPGYPFALRIEHAGVILELNKVFQKASPKPEDRFEIVTFAEAFAPYKNLPWMRVTSHSFKRS